MGYDVFHVLIFFIAGLSAIVFGIYWLYKITIAKEFFNPEVLLVMLIIASGIFSIYTSLEGFL